jgi:hypothetical protein
VKLPIVITEDRDISVHPSAEQAEAFLEPVDVKNGIYTGYDSDGNLLEISAVISEEQTKFLFVRWKTRSEVVRIKLRQPIQNREEELTTKLLQYLSNGLDQELIYQLSTQELIQMIGKRMPWSINT